MAELNSRVDSFITLLLDVSGRARPADLEAHVASGAEDLLQAYAAAHADQPLAFEGDALVVSHAPVPTPAVEVVPEPLAAPAPEPIAEESTLPEPAPFVFDANAIPEVRPEPAPAPPLTPPAMPEVAPIPVAPMPAADAAVAPKPIVTEVVIPETIPTIPVALEIPEIVIPELPELPEIPEIVIPEPGMPTVPVMPSADDSSFFEFGPAEAVADDVPDSGLTFVPVTPDDDADVPGIPAEAAPETVPDLLVVPDLPLVPDLSDLPVIEPMSSPGSGAEPTTTDGDAWGDDPL